jgi:hypothetical protein
MPLTTSYYLERAAAFEALAPQASDCGTRKNYLDLAQRFRDVAKRLSFSRIEPDEDGVSLAERMVGKTASA